MRGVESGPLKFESIARLSTSARSVHEAGRAFKENSFRDVIIVRLRHMNILRLLLAILIGFVLVFGTDFLIHGIWLKPDYEATRALWRPETEMGTRIAWMFFGQFLCAGCFMVIWALGFAGRSIGTGILVGLILGVFGQVWVIVNFVVMPVPGELAAKWFFSGLVQVMLLGMAAALIYRPRAMAG